jgi:DNA helicase-2/ATP-dependent DNA helicase PcrA
LKHLLDDLNAPQQEAVQHTEGPLLILAGPGSGKTRVITHRIAWLLGQGVPDHQILALTFTNKAADEMKRRVALLAPGSSVWLSTFHRFCARLLRQYAPLIGLRESYTIYDTEDSQRALKHTLDALPNDLSHFTPERIAAAISWAKNRLITPDQYTPRSGDPLGRIVAEVYPAYQSRLLAASAVDFDDLLMHVAVLLRDNAELRSRLDARYRHILVDEYQDTNLAQYMIIRALAQDYPNLAVTGDPDQSIYGWRGANLGNILDFEKDYPQVRVVRLEQNYRSTQRILRVADHLIAHNVRRKQKRLFTQNDEGQPVRLVTYATQKVEAEAIAQRIAEEVQSGRRRPRDYAIFYRTNALSRSLEFALRDFGIPYQMVNGLEFYQRKEIKDILAYLHLLNNPRDSVAFLRIINTPPRGIGRSTIQQLVDYAAAKAKPLLEAAREAGLIESLAKRAAVAVARFVAIYDRLSMFIAGPVEEIMRQVLVESGYQQALAESEDEGDQERLANIEELITAAREFDEQNPGENRLERFLEQASLVNDTDAWELDDDRVTLMTMHAAKGLEFPVVFIIAVEEKLLPHERSRESPADLEEERRLLFVALTRAREDLQLSLARYREFRGARRMSVPSQFLLELPREELDMTELLFADASWEADQHTDEAIHDASGEMGDDTQSDSADAADVEFAPPPQSFRLTTAAAMMEPATATTAAVAKPAVPPDAFQQGMVVRHPDYGLGKITAIDGQGAKRAATVLFASAAGERRFYLAHSSLVPAKTG